MTKDDIFNKYQQLNTIIQEVYYSIDNIVPQNDDVKEFRYSLYSELHSLSNDIKKQLEDVMENTSWDKLTIAFLGMTNAGKSTIIETLRILFDKNKNRAEDGMIVGEGQQDFTKDYNEYELTIAGKPFVLIDAPGTEGREKEYEDKIRKALGKAHCIFYVLNSKPDEPLVEKIKGYLKEGVNLYTIYNVKGATDCYDEPDERLTLIDNTKEKNIELFKDTFTNIIGDRYKGNISVQALLALCSRAQFSCERKIHSNIQKELLNYFGKRDSMFAYSEFQTLIDLIEKKSQSFLEEILEANRLKLIAKVDDIKNRLNNLLVNNEEKLSKTEDNLNNLILNTKKDIDVTREQLRYRADKCIIDFYTILRTEFLKILQNDASKKEKKEQLTIEFGYRKRVFIEQLQNIVRSELTSLKEQVKKECEGANNEYVTIAIPNFDSKELMDVSIDIDNPVDELGFGLDDAGDIANWIAIGASAGSIAGPVGVGIGAGVGFVVGGVAKIMGWKKKKIEKAIRKLDESWNISEKNVREIVGHEVNGINSRLVYENSEFEFNVQEERNKIPKMKGLLVQVQNNLDNYVEKINIR